MPEPPNPGGGPGWGVAEESLGKGRRRGRDPMGAHWAAAKRWGADGGVGLQTALSAPWGEGGVSPTVVLMVVMLGTPPAAPHRLSAVWGAPTDGPLCSDPTNPTAQPPGAQHSTPTPPQTWGALPALQPPHPPMPREQQNYLILSEGEEGRPCPSCSTSLPHKCGAALFMGRAAKSRGTSLFGGQSLRPPLRPPPWGSAALLSSFFAFEGLGLLWGGEWGGGGVPPFPRAVRGAAVSPSRARPTASCGVLWVQLCSRRPPLRLRVACGAQVWRGG